MKCSLSERRLMVSAACDFSISEQCGMLSIHRSGFYYVPQGESALNLELIQLIDSYFLDHPHSGALTLCAYLCLSKGYRVNVTLIRRLMRLMGLMTVHPAKKLSIGNKAHTIFPCLLRGLKMWQTDITCIPMKKGFMFMMAVIDVKSRYIIHLSISNTMNAGWCSDVIREAILLHGKPEIINTDQGSQFTSHEFQLVLTDNKIQIYMDGKGRALDNIYI